MIEYLRSQALITAHVFKLNNPAKEPWPYTSTADLLLDRGRPFTDEGPLSDEQLAFLTSVADRVRDHEKGRVFAPKQCFDNSMMMVLADQDDRLTYCEGYAMTGMIPVHHAWLTLDGRLVDLTRSLRPEAVDEFLAGKDPQEDLRDRILGTIPEGWQYFGIELQRTAVRDYIWELEKTGSLIEDYDRDFPMWKEKRLGNELAPDPDAWGRVEKMAVGCQK
jgi:hypothetical protein